MMLSQRAKNLKPSPTLAIAAKAKELAAQGHAVISLSVGEPDWDTFDKVKQSGIEAIKKGLTKYTPSNGIPDLREAIAKQTSEDFEVKYTAGEVTVTAGAKFTLFAALQVLVDPGDEVLIPAPYWVSYPTMAELAGGVPKIVPSTAQNRFRLQVQDLERLITSKSKVLILNSPSNPSGEILEENELKGIAEVLRKHPQLTVISDDIYNRLVFDKRKIAPHLLSIASDLKDRVIVVNGASKTYSMTGWRLGWAIGPQAVISAMTNYQSQSVSCASPFTQVATVTAIQMSSDEIKKSVERLELRRNSFVEKINAIPGWRAQKPGGGFYVWADVQQLIGKTYNGQKLNGSSAIAQALLESQKVAVVPGVESGVEGYLRLSFAVSENDLMTGAERLLQFTRELK